MIRVNARRNIAAMKNMEPARNLAAIELPTEAMRAYLLAVDFDRSAPGAINTSGPKPTARSTAHIPSKPLLNGRGRMLVT